MPILIPEQPTFSTPSESKVWELLRSQLGDDDVLISGQRISAHDKDHEIDICVAFADAGIVVVEVKGGQVWYDDGWWIDRRGRHDRIDPVTQARDAQYALRTWLDRDPRWRGRTGLRWAHALVLPYTRIDDDFATPDAQRWQVAGRDDLESLADFLRRIIVQQTNGKRPLTFDDCDALEEALGGRGLPQRDLVGLATEREDEVERLSAEQAVILQAARQLHRVE
ncbi:MAG: nuclease-related domain-containing protein, partial [Nocardioides sp.]